MEIACDACFEYVTQTNRIENRSEKCINLMSTFAIATFIPSHTHALAHEKWDCMRHISSAIISNCRVRMHVNRRQISNYPNQWTHSTIFAASPLFWRCFVRWPNHILNNFFVFVCFCLPMQSFIWPLARCASPDESIIVELRTQTTKILLRTGLATTSSTSRGTISSNSKIVGRYVMLMQGKSVPYSFSASAFGFESFWFYFFCSRRNETQ